MSGYSNMNIIDDIALSNRLDNFCEENDIGMFEFEPEQCSDDFSAILDEGQDSCTDVFDPLKLPEKVYSFVLDYCKEMYYGACPDTSISFERGDLVVAKTKYGCDVVRITGIITVSITPHIKEVFCIKRHATEREIKRQRENMTHVPNARKVFKEKVNLNNLNMKLCAVHFLTCEAKILFFFTSDCRIDFRKLVKDLVEVFKLRVELRQISSRDEARISGGLGPCGRPFCCSSITDKLTTVSGKMAKTQGFSLITQKSSGHCGRLLCCLSYEHEWYIKELSHFPPIGHRFNLDDATWQVMDTNIVSGTIIVTDGQGRILKLQRQVFSLKGCTWTINKDMLTNRDS